MMAPHPPAGRHWLHEVKLEGLRLIARKDSTRVRLYSCLGDDLTLQFPLIVAAMSRLPPCTIDGEAIACDDEPPPPGRQGDGSLLYAFDLIELSGDDRRRDPLERRKLDLHRLLAGGGPALLLNQCFDGEQFTGATVFEHACSLGRDGIISKRKDSRYISGLSPYWLKTKPRRARR
jgi:bifunctional non-homologous end joining protein LigD